VEYLYECVNAKIFNINIIDKYHNSQEIYMSVILTVTATHPKDTLLFGRSSPENQIKMEEFQKQTSELPGFISETRTRVSDTVVETNLMFDSVENFQSYLIFEQNHAVKQERIAYNTQNGITGVRKVIDSNPK
jgi:hypothetical protein